MALFLLSSECSLGWQPDLWLCLCAGFGEGCSNRSASITDCDIVIGKGGAVDFVGEVIDVFVCDHRFKIDVYILCIAEAFAFNEPVLSL